MYFDRRDVATLDAGETFDTCETGLRVVRDGELYRVSLCKLGKDIDGRVVDASLLRDGQEGEYRSLLFTSPLKNAIKRAAVGMLQSATGYIPPWGIQTGVKPVKMATKCINIGISDGDGAAFLRRELLLSEQKSDVLFQVARNERRIIEEAPEKSFSVYVGTPFCPSICSYCSFGSYPIGAYRKCVDDYVSAVLSEARAAAKVLDSNGLRCDTCYFGGGTPTSLSAGQLERMMGGILELFTPTEITCEAGRPDSIDPQKLAVIRRLDATRIAVNPQTMNDETLRRIGRRHTSADVVRAFREARDAGFDNINMDLIAALPEETFDDFRRSVDRVLELGPEGFTVHSLCLKRASDMMRSGEQYRSDAGLAEKMVDYGFGMARFCGMEPYYLYRQKNAAGNLENVGYARPGHFCRYNVLIEEETQHILGLGAGAVTKNVNAGDVRRCFNIKDPLQYIGGIEGQIAKKIDFLAEMY